jgi:hypothetical protein
MITIFHSSSIMQEQEEQQELPDISDFIQNESTSHETPVDDSALVIDPEPGASSAEGPML